MPKRKKLSSIFAKNKDKQMFSCNDAANDVAIIYCLQGMQSCSNIVFALLFRIWKYSTSYNQYTDYNIITLMFGLP